MVDDFRISSVDGSSVDGLVGSILWLGLLNLNLDSLLVNSWSHDFLFIISVSLNINSLYSGSFLNDWFSGDWVSVDNSVWSILPLNVNLFFLVDWLNISLVDSFIGRKSVRSD